MLRFSPAAVAIAILATGCCISPPISPPPPFPCGGFGCFDAGRGDPIDGGTPIDMRRSLCDYGMELGAGCGPTACAAGLTCFPERTAATRVDRPDGGERDAGPGDAGAPDAEIGDAEIADAEIADAGPVDAQIPDARVPDDGPDGGSSPTVELEITAFPGGMCSRGCVTDTDCDGCAVCVPHVLAGRARLRGPVGGTGVCRPPCTSASCRAGYACDPTTRACMEACTSDEQCRFVTEDSDGDGTDDALVYDPFAEVDCRAGICTLARPPREPCFVPTDCEVDEECVRLPAFDAPPGRCAPRCMGIGDRFTCGPGAVCAVHQAVAVCTTPCTVGDDVVLRGPTASGAGCERGFACTWLGATGNRAGACLPGNYNEVVTPNAGATCLSQDECDSPYGRGACLTVHAHAGLGVCTVRDCVPDGEGPTGLLPGVAVDDPASICDTSAGFTCRRLGADSFGGIRSACMRACTVAEECFTGFACTRVAGTSVRMCHTNCEVDSDCVSGGRCLSPDARACASTTGECACR